MGIRAVVVTSLLVATLAGCGGGTSPATVFVSSPATVFVTTGAAPTAPVQASPAKHKASRRQLWFATPSRNIRCLATVAANLPTILGCSTLNNGVTVLTGGGGTAVFLFHGPIQRHATGRIVAYGSQLRFAGFTCDSAQDGLSCTADATGAGFFLSRDLQDVVGGASWFDALASAPTPTAPDVAGGAFEPPAAPPPTDPPPTDPNFCDTHACIPNFQNGQGYPVMCSDGSWSDSGGVQGACSWHGGVAG